MMPFFYILVFVFLASANNSYSETEPVIEDVETVDGSQEQQEIGDIEKNVNNMLKLLEEMERDQSLNQKEGIFSDPGEDKAAEIDAFDGLIKPGENLSEKGTQSPAESPQKRIETANEVVRFVPEDPDSHFRLGLEYWRSQNFDQAISHFTEVIRLDPENAHAYWNLGLLNDKKSNGSEAIAYLEKAETIYTKHKYPSYAKEAQDRLQEYYEKYGQQPAGAAVPTN